MAGTDATATGLVSHLAEHGPFSYSCTMRKELFHSRGKWVPCQALFPSGVPAPSLSNVLILHWPHAFTMVHTSVCVQVWADCCGGMKINQVSSEAADVGPSPDGSNLLFEGRNGALGTPLQHLRTGIQQLGGEMGNLCTKKCTFSGYFPTMKKVGLRLKMGQEDLQGYWVPARTPVLHWDLC